MGMFLLRRLTTLIPVLLGVLTAVFLLIHMIPGDPVEVMLGEMALPADREALRVQLHLDQPLAVQYGHYLVGVLTGDLGTSMHSGRPVLEMVAERVGPTFLLTLAAMVVAISVALPLGLISALKAGTAVDHTAMVGALLGVSMPNFWLGPLLLLAFSVHLGWLPLGGLDGPLSFILPAITLGTAMAAILTRMVRASLLEVMDREFVRAALAKGLTRWQVMARHVLANALIPVITVLGLQFGALLAGAIITETVFSWPGLGRLTVEAIQTRDYPVVQGCVMFICLGYLAASLLTDICYAAADPRVRLR
ncbi:MAG: ABC transporter permease [Nitrospirota bacterium]|nr:ABC transporter permease [Nitrospirota bacterium]